MAAAVLLCGTGGVIPANGGGAMAVARLAPEACLVHPAGGTALYSPGEGGDLSAPIDPLDVELDTVLDPSSMAGAATLAPTPISTWIHVITDGPATDVSDEQIADQLAVLNQAFAGSGASAATPFSFVHAGTDRTDNPAWYGSEFDYGSTAEREAKSALRQGGAATLNVYVTETATGSSWGTFPEWYRFRPTNDGIVINRANFAGGSSLLNGDGDIGVHEVGHWLGLWHTFQDGCEGGDFVDDTPAQAAPSELRECLTAQDTCVAPGTDPVHNYMNYLMDSCADQFTAGQSDRMKAHWTKYRASTSGGGGAGSKPGKGNSRR